jgi:hypothetical protein
VAGKILPLFADEWSNLSDVIIDMWPFHTEPKIRFFVSPEMNLHGLDLNSYIRVSVSDLYIPRIGLPIWMQQNIYKSLTDI